MAGTGVAHGRVGSKARAAKAGVPAKAVQRPAKAVKQPQQQRARNTVERILAAARVLVAKQGVEALTTNRVAEAAHVNIATLYQYFSNKDDILDALLAAYMSEMVGSLDALLAQLDDSAGIEDSTRAWAMAGMAYYRQTQGVLPALVRAGGGMASRLPSLRLMEHRLMEAMRRFLVRRRAQIDVPDLDAAVYVSFHAASSVITRHLLEPGWLRDEEIVEELVRLMLRYLGVRQGTNRRPRSGA